MRASAIFLLLFCAAALAAERPRNVLFLFADDQRPDTIAAHGNEHIQTPSLDALAERGFSFRRNYCLGSIHGAVCQPSRAMVMTGRTLWRVSMDLAGVQTLPQRLRKRGVVTFGTGKWHNGVESFERSFMVGREVMIGGMSDHTKVPVRQLEDGKLGKVSTGEKFSSELFADAAIEFLKNHDGEKPFFAYVSFTSPHDPRQPPESYREHYYENRPPLPPNYLPQHPFNTGWMTGRDEGLAAWPRTKGVISDQLAEYYGMITHLDEQVGRILAALEEAGHADDTLVVYAADHGLAVGSHGLLGKQNLYEHSMGCPLIVAGPGVPQGETQALTYLLDIPVTLVDVLGHEKLPGAEGRSLAPLWRGEKERVRDTLFTTYENKMRAVTDGRWKLIRYPPFDHEQLFDLETDPHERFSLVDEPEHQVRLQELRQQLAEWQERLGDPHPLHVAEPRPLGIDLTGRPRRADRWQPKWIVEKYFGE